MTFISIEVAWQIFELGTLEYKGTTSPPATQT